MALASVSLVIRSGDSTRVREGGSAVFVIGVGLLGVSESRGVGVFAGTEVVGLILGRNT